MVIEKKINSFQLFILLIHAQIGVGMITLVNEVHMKAKADSWISLVLVGVIIQLVIVVYGLLLKRFPGKNLFEIIKIVFGKFLGNVFILSYIGYSIFMCALLLSKYTVILKTWMLPLTPKWVLVVSILLIGIYSAKDNLFVISRFFIIASSVILIFFIFVIYSFKEAHYTYLLPVGTSGPIPVLEGMLRASYSYQGFEYILMLAPFVSASNREIVRTASFVNLFITSFYLVILLASQFYFSSNELVLITEPIFYLVKSFSFNIIERPDLIFTSLWIVLVVTTIIVILFITSLGINSVLYKMQRKTAVYLASIASLLISSFIYGEDRINRLVEQMSLIILLFSAVLPIFVYIFSLIFRKKGDKAR